MKGDVPGATVADQSRGGDRYMFLINLPIRLMAVVNN